MKLSEFFVSLGFKVDASQQKKLSSAIEDTRDKIEDVIFYLEGLANTFTTLVTNTAQEAAEIAKLAQIMGVSNEEAQRWNYLAEKSGVSITDMIGLTSELAENVGEAAGGTGEAAVAFKDLGLATKDAKGKLKEVPQLMADIADKFAAMPDGQKKTAALMGLFGEEGVKLVGVLNQGSEGINKMMSDFDALGLSMGGDAVKSTKKFNDQWTTFTSILTNLKQTIGTEALEGLNSLLADGIEFWKKNKESIKAVASVVTKALLKAFSLVGKAFAFVFNLGAALVEKFPLLGTILKGVVIAAIVGLIAYLGVMTYQFVAAGVAAVAAAIRVGAAWLAANAPLMLWAAGLALVLLILEDIWGWWNGKDSLIGRIIDGLREKWDDFIKNLEYENPNDPWFLKVIKDAVSEVKELLGYLREIGQWAGSKYETVSNAAGSVDSYMSGKQADVQEWLGIESDRQRYQKAYTSVTPEQSKALLDMLGGFANHGMQQAAQYIPASSVINNTAGAQTKTVHQSNKFELRIEQPAGSDISDLQGKVEKWVYDITGTLALQAEEVK